MRILITILFLCLLFVLSGNAQTRVQVGQQITSADTVTTELYIFPLISDPQTLYIKCDSTNSGTLRFSAGEVIDMNKQYQYVAGSQLIITILQGRYSLRYKASGAGQKFVITH